jgi:cell division protein FtsQ
MTPVAAPADKRFRRSKVSPARKRRWLPSWWTAARLGAVTIVVGFALYETIGFVLASEVLAVTRITVQGNQRMSRGEVLGLLDGLSGASIVMTDLESWRQKLLESPWVADASIRRMFPGTLAIVIEERQPIGIGRIKGRLFLIDEMGAVVDEFGPNYADLDLPIIDGLAATGGENESVDERRAALAGRLMSELAHRPALAGQVSQIDVSDVRNAVVTLKADTALLRVGDERFSERLQSYLDLRPALRERMPDIDYVDLRFDSRVYVRPQSARLRPSASARPARLRASGASARQGASGGQRSSPARRGG